LNGYHRAKAAKQAGYTEFYSHVYLLEDVDAAMKVVLQGNYQNFQLEASLSQIIMQLEGLVKERPTSTLAELARPLATILQKPNVRTANWAGKYVNIAKFSKFNSGSPMGKISVRVHFLNCMTSSTRYWRCLAKASQKWPN
jgi:hypothetical protein